MESHAPGDGQPLRIEGELTIYSAAGLADRIAAAATDTAGDVRLDLSQVTDIDTAGLQLLLLARKLAHARGARALIDASPRVAALLRLCRLEDMLGSSAQATVAS